MASIKGLAESGTIFKTSLLENKYLNLYAFLEPGALQNLQFKVIRSIARCPTFELAPHSITGISKRMCVSKDVNQKNTINGLFASSRSVCDVYVSYSI